MNLLFITSNGIIDADYGGPKGSIRNYRCLQKFGDVTVYEIKKRSNYSSLIAVMQRNFPPILYSDGKAIKKLVTEKKIRLVFFDGSEYGMLVKQLKDLPCSTVVFCHNFEKEYINVRFGMGFSLKKMIYDILIRRNEKLSVQSADCVAVFTERDRRSISKYYSVTIESVLPLAIDDKWEGQKFLEDVSDEAEYKCLLFGPAMKANLDGFQWFMKEVSPYLNCKTLVAGKGTECLRGMESDKIEVRGYIDNLMDLYLEVNSVALPLLSGGGMKVKTVEGLMFGKFLFGTDEAFEGFEAIDAQIGTRCNTSEEFIREINRHINSNCKKYNKISRELYLKAYSIKASEGLFDKMIGSLIT